jgi:hypothetical protein
MRNVAQGIPSEIPFTTEALRATLARIRDEWDNYQASRDRDGVYRYLEAVFQLVEWWAHERRAKEYAQQALRLQRPPIPKISDPFAVVIFATADREKVDFKTRSKWARLLRYAKVFKDPDKSLSDFVRHRGGINRCVRRYSRRFGRTWSTGRQ